MIVHIYTGAKGGVGKTLCALSTATKYLFANRKVLCVDLNWENADLAKIMCLGEIKRQGVKFVYSTLADGSGLILEPAIPFQITSGSIGFWASLSDALDEARKIHKFIPDIVILDTGLHFCNLLRRSSPEATERGLKRINRVAEEHDIGKLQIWFLWTLAAVCGRRDHIPAIQSTLSLFNNGLEEFLFQPDNNFIHIFNPHALYPVTNMIKMALSGIKGMFDSDFSQSELLNRMQDVVDANVTEGINFEALVTRIFDKVTNKLGNRPADTVGFLNFFAKEILQEYNGMRPRNIFTIPVYESQIVGYTDLFARENPTRLENIADDINPVLKILSKFIDELK